MKNQNEDHQTLAAHILQKSTTMDVRGRARGGQLEAGAGAGPTMILKLDFE